jgi:hypothetical protein
MKRRISDERRREGKCQRGEELMTLGRCTNPTELVARQTEWKHLTWDGSRRNDMTGIELHVSPAGMSGRDPCYRQRASSDPC